MANVMDRKQANRLFLRVVELIAQTGALPLPRYVQLFFEYAQGQNTALNSAIDEILQRGEQPSASELDLLFELHVDEPAESETLGEMGDRLDEEVRDALHTVQEAVLCTRSFGDTVHRAETQFDGSSNPETVRLALTSLAQATRQMSQHSAEMDAKLSASLEHIEQLKSDLDKVRVESQTDSLTGAANRKCFDQTLVKEVAEARRQSQPLSLCMVDVDHFKKFNDAYGHPAGDSVLRFVASMFRHSVRDYDLVARYGGEEFAVIMPSADLSVAVTVSNRIREKLSAKEFIRRSNGESLGYITTSVGVGQLREDDTPESLIERADQALYQAKRAGRNRVESETNEAGDQSDPSNCAA